MTSDDYYVCESTALLDAIGTTIKSVNKKQTKKNWQFMFLGANLDAVSEAGRIGIRANRAVTYANDSVGVRTNYVAVGIVLNAFSEPFILDKEVWDIVENMKSRLVKDNE